jgi:GNAT superfamily N-acetyltransferase
MIGTRVQVLDPESFGAAAELFAATFPLRVAEIATWRDPRERELPRRYAVLADSAQRLIGFCALWRFRADGYRMDLIVTPDQRRRGIGGRLLTRLVGQAREAAAITLQARADSGWTESLRFLRARGFTETMRMHRQVLDVAAATLGPYRAIEQRLAAEGITMATLSHELSRDRLCWARFAALHETTEQGWVDPDPRPVPDPAWSPAELRRRHRGAAGRFWLGEGGAFLARHNDRYVGFSGALGTGVHPAYRGRGIATALKVRVILAAVVHNVPTLSTSSGNPTMLRINERLGYRHTSTEIRLVRPLA